MRHVISGSMCIACGKRASDPDITAVCTAESDTPKRSRFVEFEPFEKKFGTAAPIRADAVVALWPNGDAGVLVLLSGLTSGVLVKGTLAEVLAKIEAAL